MSNQLFSIFLMSASLFCASVSFAHETKYQEVQISENLFYTDIQCIYPSQLRYSSKNVQEKVDYTIRLHDANWNEDTKSWDLKYDGGKSPLSPEDAVPVVRGPFGLVLTDGHHHLLASLQLNAQTIPVKVIADLSQLDETSFWAEMEQNGWAYPYNILGERSPPPKDVKLLQDDPNRYFAAIIARKCRADGDLNSSRGATYPVWVKVGKDIPFIEFRISDALWKKGLRYNYDMGDNPSEALVEESRQILLDAKIPGLRVVPERTHYLDVKLGEQR